MRMQDLAFAERKIPRLKENKNGSCMKQNSKCRHWRHWEPHHPLLLDFGRKASL